MKSITEADFEKVPGVIDAVSGYTGGHVKNPTYKQVSAGRTGHTEAVEVYYDPEKIGYAELLEVFWRNIDPTDPHGQFCDKGSQYRSEIFYHDEQQKKLAESSRRALTELKPFEGDIATGISRATVFYPAEEYHQRYFEKNGGGYCKA